MFKKRHLLRYIARFGKGVYQNVWIGGHERWGAMYRIEFDEIVHFDLDFAPQNLQGQKNKINNQNEQGLSEKLTDRSSRFWGP